MGYVLPGFTRMSSPTGGVADQPTSRVGFYESRGWTVYVEPAAPKQSASRSAKAAKGGSKRGQRHPSAAPAAPDDQSIPDSSTPTDPADPATTQGA